METHSSILVWRIPWTEEPGELQSKESDMTEQQTLSLFTVGLDAMILVFNVEFQASSFTLLFHLHQGHPIQGRYSLFFLFYSSD